MSNTVDSAQSASTSSFVTSLIVNSAIAGGELVGFIVIRGWFKVIYEPRTYIPARDEQAKPLGKHWLWPLWTILMADPDEILEKNGVDAYVFVRFLSMMSKAMIPIWLISWIVLMPINSVGQGVEGKTGLDRYTFGNISPSHQRRVWAHLVLNWFFVGWVLYLIWGEMRNWLVIRQKYLINPNHNKLSQSNTVLITGIPPEYMDEVKLEKLYGRLPGGVDRIWLTRDLKEMPGLWERRADAAKKLESAQVKLIKLARKVKVDREAKLAKLEKKGKPVPEPVHVSSRNGQVKGNEAASEDRGPPALEADQLVPRDQRPTSRLKPKWAPFSLGWLGIGQKVDTIDWARSQIQEISPQLAASREQLRRDTESPGYEEDFYPPVSSAFIHFNQQISAHLAAQGVAHHLPVRMSGRYIEQSPENIIWRNLSLNAYEANVRKALSWAATGGLLIAWAFPVAFVGALSNVKTLTDQFHWLRWLLGDDFGHHLLQGVVSGLLPPILLAILMGILPVILRELAKLEGIPSKIDVELDLMTRYFVFMVVHTFFIVTLTSGLIAAVNQLARNPASIASVLATQLPTASTFFITLILTQFTGTMGNLLMPSRMTFFYIKVFLFGSSPRSVYNSRYSLPTNSWGTQFPGVSVYAVIVLGYMIISPIINGFGALFFLFSNLVYKYLYIWVYDQPAAQDTGGEFFPMAIQHVFVGLYVEEVCMIALFFLARNADGKASAIPQAVLMIILTVLTAAAQYTIDTSYRSVKHFLPLTLAHLSYGTPEDVARRESSAQAERRRLVDDPDLQQPYYQVPLRALGQGRDIVKAGLDLGRDAVELIPGAKHVTTRLERGHKSLKAMSPYKSQHATFDPDNVNHYGVKEQSSVTDGTMASTRTANGVQPVARDFVDSKEMDPLPESIQDAQIPPQEIHGIDTAPGPPQGETRAYEMSPIAPRPHHQDTFDSIGTAETAFDEEGEEVMLAVPGGPGVQKVAQTQGDDPDAFFHPATKDPMRIIWLPKDELGLCEAEMRKNQEMGIKSTSKHARLNLKGRIRVTGPPPDDF